MASTIGKVRAVFTASTSGLTSGVNAAAASMRRMEASVASLRTQTSALVAINATQLFASMASGAISVGRSFAGMVVSTADAVSSMNDLAGRLGTTYGELAGFSYAGSLVGVGMDAIGAAMTKADVAFVRAAEGSATAIAAFQGLGLSVEQLNGLSAAERFEAIAQAISQLPTEAQRAEAAVQLFGRAGAELLPLFAQGAAGIQEARAEAERFGLTLTNAQAGNIDAMGDSFDRAKAAITGVIQQVVAYLAPAIESVTTAFSDLIGNVGGATIGQTIGEGILQGARFLAQVADAIIPTFNAAFSYLSQVGAQWNAVFAFGNRVAQFFFGIGNALEAAFGIIVMGITGPVQSLMEAAQFIGDRLGVETPGIDKAVASMNAFNDTLGDGITENLRQAGVNFSNAFFGGNEANKAGEAIAGPFTAAVDTAIAAAQAAAADTTAATAQTVTQRPEVQEVAVSLAKDAIKGIDSRSTEGIREMFRIMRGQQDTAADQTARNTGRMVSLLENLDMGEEVADLAPAAGA